MPAKPLKILQILPSLDDGGVERGVVDSNRRYVQAGCESWVISAGGKRVAEIEADGGHHLTLEVKSKNPLSAPWRMLQLRRALRQLRPDLIHYRSRVPGWLTRWANRARDLRLPTVSTLHGLNHPCFYSSVMVRADRVICVSSAGLAFAQANYPWVDPARLAVIPRGVDVARFDPARADRAWMAAFAREQGLEGKFVVSAIGRVSALKGVDILIRAVAKLHAQWPELTALVVGGPQRGQESVYANLQSLARELGVAEAVRFVGSQRNIPEIAALSRAVCSCNVSKPESFGRTVAEALAMGTPVIAAAHGGVLDIVRPDRDGYLVPPGDVEALAEALLRLRSAAFTGLREHITATFTADVMAERTLALYRELLAERAQ